MATKGPGFGSIYTQPRRHRIRKEQRRCSARDWARISPQAVTVRSYARQYGVDRHTAYEDLTAIGFGLPATAQRRSKRPPAVPRRREAPQVAEPFPLGDSLIVLDGRTFFVAGYTSGGAPYGVFVDEPTTEDRQAEPIGYQAWSGPSARALRMRASAWRTDVSSVW